MPGGDERSSKTAAKDLKINFELFEMIKSQLRSLIKDTKFRIRDGVILLKRFWEIKKSLGFPPYVE